MQPGRELDALVAERVFGLPVVWTSSPPYFEMKILAQLGQYGRLPYMKGSADGVTYDWAKVPQYSTDSNDALSVLEQLRKDYVYLNVITLHRSYQVEAVTEANEILAVVSHESFPTALCLAALAAKGVEIE